MTGPLTALGVGALLAWVALPLLALVGSSRATAPAGRHRALTAALGMSAVFLFVPWFADLLSTAGAAELGAETMATWGTPIVFEAVAITAHQATSTPWLAVVGGVWLLAAVAGASWLAFRLARARHVIAGAQALCHVRVDGLDIATREGANPDQIHVSSAIEVPFATGAWRPVIVLPEVLVRELSAAELALVIRHELTHIRMGHTLSVLGIAATSVLFFGHPVLPWLLRELSLARELAVDQAVGGSSPETYATMLLDVAARSGSARPSWEPAMAASSLRERVEVMLETRFPRRRSRALLSIAAGAMFMGTTALWLSCASGDAEIVAESGWSEGLPMGALPKEKIQGVISLEKEMIRLCYERELQKDWELAGRLSMRWLIAPTGKVARVAVNESDTTLENAGMQTCITEAIAEWVFPPPAGNGYVEVNYPFVFAAVAVPDEENGDRRAFDFGGVARPDAEQVGQREDEGEGREASPKVGSDQVLDRDAIIGGAREGLPAVMPCLRTARESGALPRGRHSLILAWVVQPDGSIANPELTGPEEVVGTALATCVVDGMKKWRFPQAEESTPVRNFPFGPFTVK